MSCSWSMPRLEPLGHLPTTATVGAQGPGKQEQRGSKVHQPDAQAYLCNLQAPDGLPCRHSKERSTLAKKASGSSVRAKCLNGQTTPAMTPAGQQTPPIEGRERDPLARPFGETLWRRRSWLSLLVPRMRPCCLIVCPPTRD